MIANQMLYIKAPNQITNQTRKKSQDATEGLRTGLFASGNSPNAIIRLTMQTIIMMFYRRLQNVL